LFASKKVMTVALPGEFGQLEIWQINLWTIRFTYLSPTNCFNRLLTLLYHITRTSFIGNDECEL